MRSVRHSPSPSPPTEPVRGFVTPSTKSRGISVKTLYTGLQVYLVTVSAVLLLGVFLL